jgi:hypothetical protein
VLPDEDQDSAPADDNTKVKTPQPDDQLQKAIQVLKNRETKS